MLPIQQNNTDIFFISNLFLMHDVNYKILNKYNYLNNNTAPLTSNNMLIAR